MVVFECVTCLDGFAKNKWTNSNVRATSRTTIKQVEPTSSSQGLRLWSTMMSYPSSSKQPTESGTWHAIESSVRHTMARMRAHSSGEASWLSGCRRTQASNENLHPAPMPALSWSSESECLLMDELVRCENAFCRSFRSYCWVANRRRQSRYRYTRSGLTDATSTYSRRSSL